MHIKLRVAAMLLGLPWVAAAGWAQLEPSPDAAPVSNAPAPPPQKPVATFKMNVSLVDLFFTVKNKHGELMPHLAENDCSVSENGVPQKLKSFAAETDLPLTLGVLLDTSGSQVDVLPLEQQAGSQFLRQVLRPKDEAFLLSFDVNVNLLQDYTNDAQELAQAMNKAQINDAGGGGSAGIPGLGQGPVPVYGTPKGTLLYDAIYQAAYDKMSEQGGRKAMIILTDGEDEGSDHTLQQAVNAALKNNVMIYVILIADPHFYGGFGLGYTGYSAAKKLSDETGGQMIDVGNNGPKLRAAFAEIEDELRTEYLATYTSTDAKMDGTFRSIAVNCGKGTHVQVKKGYYALPSPLQ
jgi:VWFA-related protein